jgi:hypothetical protein
MKKGVQKNTTIFGATWGQLPIFEFLVSFWISWMALVTVSPWINILVC